MKKKKINLLKRFLSWCRRVFAGEAQRYPVQLEAIRTGTHGKLVPIERFTPYACQTWRFMPNYPTNPIGAQVFLYCDDIQEVSRENLRSTHRLSVVLVSPSRSRIHWWCDYDMTSLFCSTNCANIVCRLLAMPLLRNRYDDIKWGEMAEKYVARHRPGFESCSLSSKD